MIKNIVGIVVFAFVILGCAKEKEEEINFSQLEQSTKDQSFMESEFNSVFQLSTELSKLEVFTDLSIDGPAYDGNLPRCANLSYNAVSRVLTVDFGSEDCLCKDGLLRRGSFTITFDETPFSVVNSEVTVNFETYSVQSIPITGKIVLKNVSGPGANIIEYNVIDAKAYIGSAIISWETSVTISRISGSSTANVFDDIYQIEGSSTGINRRGVSYTAQTVNPLKKKVQIGCIRTFVSGEVLFTDEDSNTALLNYNPNNDEACDRLVSVIINDTYNFTFNVR